MTCPAQRQHRSKQDYETPTDFLEAAETTEAVAWWESMLARQVELDEAERLATWDEVLP